MPQAGLAVVSFPRAVLLPCATQPDSTLTRDSPRTRLDLSLGKSESAVAKLIGTHKAVCRRGDPPESLSVARARKTDSRRVRRAPSVARRTAVKVEHRQDVRELFGQLRQLQALCRQVEAVRLAILDHGHAARGGHRYGHDVRRVHPID